MSTGKQITVWRVRPNDMQAIAPGEVLNTGYDLILKSDHDAALRAAKIEGLEDVARYCRGECVVQCDDNDRWQKGHNVAAEHIAKFCDRKVDEVKS